MDFFITETQAIIPTNYQAEEWLLEKFPAAEKCLVSENTNGFILSPNDHKAMLSLVEQDKMRLTFTTSNYMGS